MEELEKKEKIDLLNEKIKLSLGEHYNGAYISYNTPLFHLEPLFEQHHIEETNFLIDKVREIVKKITI